MNRRITIFDQEDFKTNHLLWWSLPLGDEIYSVQTLEAMSPEEREAVLNVGEGDGVLMACGSGFNMVHERLHLGIRNENFSDCQILPRLSAEGGAYLKCIPPEFPDDETIKQFMSPKFTEHIDYIKTFNFRYKVLHTIEDAHRFLGWLEQQPEDTFFGYDVEASGMAIDRWFELSGLSICTLQYGGFISLTDIRHQVGKESAAYTELMAGIGAFLQSRMTHIWVYNMQYEYQVSFRMFNVDLYDLCDAMAVNILDGYHLNKRFSLKFSSQRILSVREWDSAFERISSLMESMLYTEIGTKKSERQKVLKVDQSNFKNTPEWNELCNRYPEYIGEFEQLILEYWGNAYMPIPSEILGKYCCLDSWYTLLLFESRRQTYSETCFNVFLDNLRLACQLHSCGVPKWEEYNTEYSNYCDTQMVWGILFCAASRCQIKMRKHQAKMADINKYNPICRILLEQRRFYNGDPLAITKDLLSSYLDEFDCTETGLDEGRLMLVFGDKFAEDFVSLVKDAMVEVKMKTKIDATIIRKKKILGIIAEGLITLLGLDKIKINNRHIELEKYIFYETAYKELVSVYQKQVKDIEHVPETIYFEKTKFSRLEFADYVSEKYFKCKSPIENDEICLELAQLYSTETAYLAALKDGVHWMKGEKDYYKNLGITTIEDAFKHFQGEYTKAWNGTPIEQTGYPSKVYELFNEGYGALKKGKLTDSVKDIFSDFSGFETQENFFPYVKGQFLEYAKPFDPSDLDNNMFFLRKMVINYLLFKKYSKLKSSYTDSLFKKTDKLILEDPKTHVILREAGEDERDNPNVKVRMIPAYECCMKSSKRWSGPYHVIPSHLDVKAVVRAYPGCLLSYFDISSAEVRAAAAQSKDAHLNELFNTRQDVYNFAAKLYVGEDKYEQLSKADKKKLRKNFKTVMLGVLYGLGKCNAVQYRNILENQWAKSMKAEKYRNICANVELTCEIKRP